MAVQIVRLGSPRQPGEGIRLGTVRHLPRGVRKEDYARRDYFDLWLPELAPGAKLLASARSAEMTTARWEAFAKRYRREMQAPVARRLLALLALMSRTTSVSIGCYCEDEAHCHRSLLRGLLVDAGAIVSPARGRQSASERS
jgi:uncharacterized protein YeaO (DUF488 family)